jgi:uncharacterized protein YbjT (DUF2867 family)
MEIDQSVLEIKDSFLIRGRGLVVIPILPLPKRGRFTPFDTRVTIRRPDGTAKQLDARVQVEHFSLVDGTGEWKLIFLISGASKVDVPAGSQILVHENISAMLVAAEERGGNMNSTEGKTIVVVGATGRQGQQVSRHLVQQGWHVRGLTRKPTSQKASLLKELGVHVVQANLEDRASLDTAFKNAYGVYNMQPPVLGKIETEIRQGKNVADAVHKAGVQHLVFGSAGPIKTKTGIEQWDAKIEITEMMKALGLPLTTLRPTAFMELMTDPNYYPSSSTWYTMPKLAGWDTKIPWLSVQDLGAIAAQVFAHPEIYLGQDLALAADVKSLAECRSLYQQVRGRSPSTFPMPMFLFEKFVGKDIPNMWRWLASHPVNVDTNPTQQIHPEVMTVSSWLGSRD